MDTLLERVKKRLSDINIEDDKLNECIQTISDRLCLRLGTQELPLLFNSVCVDAVVKMYNRIYYEGITSESGGNISTSFVEDILNEYEQEIEGYLNFKKNNNEDGSEKVVRFL